MRWQTSFNNKSKFPNLNRETELPSAAKKALGVGVTSDFLPAFLLTACGKLAGSFRDQDLQMGQNQAG